MIYFKDEDSGVLRCLTTDSSEADLEFVEYQDQARSEIARMGIRTYGAVLAVVK